MAVVILLSMSSRRLGDGGRSRDIALLKKMYNESELEYKSDLPK